MPIHVIGGMSIQIFRNLLALILMRASSDGDAGGSKVLDLNDLGLNLSGCCICYFHQELRKHMVQLIDRL